MPDAENNKRGTLVKVAVLLAWLAIWPPIATSAESAVDRPHFSMSPATLYAAASAASVPEGADVGFLEVGSSYEFDGDGSFRYVQHNIYKVLTPAGAEQWNSMSVGWSPWIDDKPTMNARVVLADGTSYTLEQSTVADTAAQSADSLIYSDQRLLRAPLPAVAPGAVVETEYVLHERLPFNGAGRVGRAVLQYFQPVEHFHLSLDAPSSLALRYRTDRAPDLVPRHAVNGERERWEFESGPVAALEDLDYGLPSDQSAVPQVTFSTGESWNALAKAYSKIVAAQLTEPGVQALVDKLISGLSTRDQRAAAIVHYLNREIRYTGIEFDQASVIPHTTTETLARRYGDCKDKALLLVAMMRAAGIKASMALLNAGERLDVAPDQPGMGLFDHAIAFLPGEPGEPGAWIDATDEYARFGQLPDADRGRWALVVDSATESLTRIAEASSADNLLVEEREFVLADFGASHVVETSHPNGAFESEFRAEFANVADKSTREKLTDYVKSTYAAERLVELERSEPKDFTSPFNLKLGAGKARRAWTSLDEASMYIPIGGLFSNLPGDWQQRELTEEENAKATHPRKKRSADYQLARPYSVEWRYRIVPPGGFEAATLPANIQQSLGPASFSELFSLDPDGAVRAILRFDSVKRRYTAAEISALRQQLADLIAGDATKVKFELTARKLLEHDNSAAAFQSYRASIAARPKDAVPRLRHAKALLEVGLGDAARREAATAVKLDSKSVVAEQTLAWILRHDKLGRWHGAGADLAAAATAYRAAIALDADDKSLVGEYAIMLEYNTLGIRYGDGADLAGAIAEYQRLSPAQLADLGLAGNVSFALFFKRDFSGALRSAMALDAPAPELLVASEAELRGAAEAVEQARRRAANDKQLREQLSAAGQLLLQLRDFTLAADLLEAASTGSGMSGSAGMISTLRATKRHETLVVGSGPEDLVRQMLITAMSKPPNRHLFDSYMSRAALEMARLSTDSELNTAVRGLQSMQGMMRRSGMAADVAIDVGLAFIQITVAGNDQLGYTLSARAPNQRLDTFVVVKEDEHYKVVGAVSDPAPIGLEVLDRAARSELAGAGTMLATVREGMSGTNSDDRYGINPFTHFWPRDQRQGDAPSTKLAAAMLLLQHSASAARAIPILEAASTAIPEAEAEYLELALMNAYKVTRAFGKGLPLAERLMARDPHSRAALDSRLFFLRALSRHAEAEQLIRQRLEQVPDDIQMQRALAGIWESKHDYARAYELIRDVVANPRSQASDLNWLAWDSLYFDRPGGADEAAALKALQTRPDGFTAAMHTLASIYATNGKLQHAHELLVREMDLLGRQEPESAEWFVLGRIAEQCGEREIALGAYGRVEPPEAPEQEYDSVYRLTQDRMVALGAAAARASPAAAH